MPEVPWISLLSDSSLLSGLIGALIGGAIQSIIGQSQLKTTTTMRLYDEFDQQSFIQDRMHVSDLLKDNRQGVNPLSYKELEGALDNSDWSKIERVRLFFERLTYLSEANLVNKRFVNSAFGQIGGAWLLEFEYLDGLDRDKFSKIDVYRFTRSNLIKIFGRRCKFCELNYLSGFNEI